MRRKITKDRWSFGGRARALALQSIFELPLNAIYIDQLPDGTSDAEVEVRRLICYLEDDDIIYTHPHTQDGSLSIYYYVYYYYTTMERCCCC